MNRALGVACGASFTFLAGGAVYGYQAVQPLLVAEGAMASGCGGISDCSSQRLRLNLVFTITMGCLFVFVLVFGIIMDHFGARTTMAVAVSVNALGSLLLLLAPRAAVGTQLADGLWALGFILWGIASPGVFTSAFALANLFPEHSGIVTSTVICSFDAAAFVFLAFQVAYNHASASWSTIVAIYMVICALMGAVTVVSLPPWTKPAAAVPSEVEDTSANRRASASVVPPRSLSLNTDGSLVQHARSPPGRQTRFSTGNTGTAPANFRQGGRPVHSANDDSSTVDLLRRFIETADNVDRDYGGDIDDVGSHSIVADDQKFGVNSAGWWPLCRTPSYLFSMLLMVTFTLKNSFYIGTLSEQLSAVTSASAAEDASRVFNVVFPLGGIVFFPVVSFIVHRFKDRDDIVFGTVWLLGVIHGALNATDCLGCQVRTASAVAGWLVRASSCRNH